MTTPILPKIRATDGRYLAVYEVELHSATREISLDVVAIGVTDAVIRAEQLANVATGEVYRCVGVANFRHAH